MRKSLAYLFTLSTVFVCSSLVATNPPEPLDSQNPLLLTPKTSTQEFNQLKAQLDKPTVAPDSEYSDTFYSQELPLPFSPDNSCKVTRLEANTWIIRSPQHLYFEDGSVFLAPFEKKLGLALYRLPSAQNRFVWPIFWENPEQIPEKTLLILWQEAPSLYGAVVPVMGDQAIVELYLKKNQLFAKLDTGAKVEEADIPLAVMSYDINPYRLIERVLRQAKNHTPFPEKAVVKRPVTLDYIGWSSEKQFPDLVDGKAMMELILNMEKDKLPIGHILLDSTWQTLDETQQLHSFAINDSMLLGLEPIVKEAKLRLGLKAFGVSHSIFGSSKGVARFSNIGKEFQLLRGGLVHPDEFSRFIHHLHEPLHRADVDFILVKHLASVYEAVYGYTPLISSMVSIRAAFDSSYQKTFEPGLILDSAHDTVNLFYSAHSDIIRTANHLPAGSQEMTSYLLLQNAYATLLASPISYVDWGPFTASHKLGWKHAAANMLSGGLLYFNDRYEDIDPHLINAVCLPGGRTFSWEHSALPTRSSLFFDPSKDQPLMIFNTQNGVKVLGIFNLKDERSGYLIGPQDVDIPNQENSDLFALYSYKEGYLGKISPKDWIQRKVKGQDWDVVSFIPVHNGVAVVGNPRSFNPHGWIDQVQWKEQDNVSQLNIKTKGKGPIVLVTSKHPYAVYHNGIKLPFNWDGKLLEIDFPIGEGSMELEVFFFKKD